MAKQPDLDSAYALKTPEDNRKLYADWAQSYDEGFAARMAYRLPALVAAAYDGGGPVLDVGAGTGLLGQALAARGFGPVDGIDLSAEMLAVARGKSVYRDLLVADVTQALDLPQRYAGVVSSGTFTHGHVGPGAIAGLLDVALPGARFVLSVNKAVFEAQGFAAVLVGLAARITGLRLREEAIYDDAPDPAHRGDRAIIVTFWVR